MFFEDLGFSAGSLIDSLLSHLSNITSTRSYFAMSNVFRTMPKSKSAYFSKCGLNCILFEQEPFHHKSMHTCSLNLKVFRLYSPYFLECQAIYFFVFFAKYHLGVGERDELLIIHVEGHTSNPMT